MGIFGSSPQKKLEKARAHLAQQNYYEALRLFEELGGTDSRLAPGEISEAQEGGRKCRAEMIRERLAESEALRQAGDLEGARDRCRTALELAGEDLDDGPAQEQLRKIDAPRRPSSPTGTLSDAVETDLLPEADETIRPKPTPVDRQPSAAPRKSDEELFGDDPEALFEVYLHTFDPETADLYRSMGSDFRLGYLALVGGDGHRAVEYLERLDWSASRDARLVLERAHAYLVAGRSEESLAILDAMPPPEEGDLVQREGGARRRYLRVEVLRAVERYEEAIAEARSLADSMGGENMVTEALLAWTLLEAGRAEETYERLKGWLEAGIAPEEILVPGAQAAAILGHTDQAIAWLRSIIEARLQRSVMHGTEVEFPIEAGRRLLDIYLQEETDPKETRSLALHLLDHDKERSEAYRDLLLKLDAAP